MTKRRFRPDFGARPVLDFLPTRIAPSDITALVLADGGVDNGPSTGTNGDPGSVPTSPVWTGPCTTGGSSSARDVKIIVPESDVIAAH